MVNGVTPLIFPLQRLGSGIGGFGVAPFIDAWSLPAVRQVIAGVSRDSGGAPLAGCTCILFRVQNDLSFVQEQTVVSDGSGNYSFVVGTGTFRVMFDLAAPDRAGVTAKTLTGTST